MVFIIGKNPTEDELFDLDLVTNKGNIKKVSV